mmetsp:Transcript_7476/g.21277  ORF Transcript_7476/g.21277 Transcript_7476/m.21277 type:complete len:182 (-) Transcript_7476:24-569(-)|eukprot:CAMPEP_0170246204 /NCGR_PEP_ID=MMETSP0116_2-20130129/22888_1 /TAXON_ID=400756 /ORGANISM="Durinskia baltica, Strain CSIRO CS-38" /LENGTH=181 /DNA_ID=CAMNT_0010497079 /DNA_START=55 /DNA_END=600 /DNA_ORIENTATION=+
MAPITNFLGCLPLPAAVYYCFVQCFIRAFVLLCVVSSKDDLNIGGVAVPGIVQVLVAMFAVFGPPLAVLAGFGTLFRMEGPVLALARYMAATVTVDATLAIVVLVNGELCLEVAHELLLRRGPMFICTIINLGSVFWISVYLAFEAYVAFAVREQAGVIRKGEFAELLRYESTMQGARTVM